VGPEAYSKLLPAMKEFHGGVGGTVIGPMVVTRGSGFLMRTLGFFGRLPPASGKNGYSHLSCVSDGNGNEVRVFDYSHTFKTRFEATRHGFVENVLGGLIQFKFEHVALPSEELVGSVNDISLCESLFNLPTLNSELVISSVPPLVSSLDSGQYWGWKGKSVAIFLFWGYVRLPSFFSKLLYVEDVNVPHRDGVGWLVQVQLFTFFGLLLGYVGHVQPKETSRWKE